LQNGLDSLLLDVLESVEREEVSTFQARIPVVVFDRLMHGAQCLFVLISHIDESDLDPWPRSPNMKVVPRINSEDMIAFQYTSALAWRLCAVSTSSDNLLFDFRNSRININELASI